VNIELDKGVLRSTIKFILRFGGEPLSLEDLPHDLANQAYGIIRQNLMRFQSGYGINQATQIGKGGVAPSRKCPKCGASVEADQKFCGNCGAKV
jgi:hypothetical protein